MRSFSWLILLFALVAGLSLVSRRPAALAAPLGTKLEEQEVVGKSKPDLKNAAEAQHSAEEDALKAAIDASARELLGGKVTEKQAAGLAARILKNPHRYVPEYRVIDRSGAATAVVVKVKAKVNVDLLRSDMVAAGIIASETSTVVMTRVVVLPGGNARTNTPPWWAAGGEGEAPVPLTRVLVDALRAKGFDVIEPRRAEHDPNSAVTPTPAPEPDLSNENLQTVAKSYEVDMFLKVPWAAHVDMHSLEGVTYGVARAKVGPIEAISVKDGSILAKAEGQGVGGEVLDPVRVKTGQVPAEVTNRISEAALKAAAVDAADHLVAQLGDPASSGGTASTVDLVVAGLDSYAAYTRFQSTLVQVKGVRSALLHSIERGEATWQLSLERGIDSASFADAVGKTDFSDFSVKVTEKSPSRVVLHVVR